MVFILILEEVRRINLVCANVRLAEVLLRLDYYIRLREIRHHRRLCLPMTTLPVYRELRLRLVELSVLGEGL